MAKNKVKFNICNVHVALILSRENGVPTFDTPIPVPGAVSITLEPKGEQSVFYADGVEYYKSDTNLGYEGEWETAMLPDELREKIFKEVMDAKKVLFEKTESKYEPFAYGVQIDGDEKNTRFWFYNMSAARPSTASKTTEGSKDPQTDTIKVSAAGEKIFADSDDLYIRSKTTDTTDTETYNNWFKQVYIPVAVPGTEVV